jgi:hypothetical protein
MKWFRSFRKELIYIRPVLFGVVLRILGEVETEVCDEIESMFHCDIGAGRLCAGTSLPGAN